MSNRIGANTDELRDGGSARFGAFQDAMQKILGTLQSELDAQGTPVPDARCDTDEGVVKAVERSRTSADEILTLLKRLGGGSAETIVNAASYFEKLEEDNEEAAAGLGTPIRDHKVL